MISKFICILVCYCCCSCLSIDRTRILLEKKGEELIKNGKHPFIDVRSYKKPILCYFDRPLLSIIEDSHIQGNIPQGDTLYLYYEFGLDLKFKSLVYSKLNVSKGSPHYTEKLIKENDVGNIIYKGVKIKKEDVNLFNFPQITIRGERMLYYKTRRFSITQDTIYYNY